MKRYALALLLVLAFAGTAAAQTPAVEAGKTFGVAASHDGLNTDNYDAIVDGAVVATLPFSALANGDITFSGLTAPARGAHTVVIRARNIDNLSADSDPLAFNTTKGKPNKPGKPRIVSGLLAALQAPGKLLAKLTGRDKAKGFGTIRIITEG